MKTDGYVCYVLRTALLLAHVVARRARISFVLGDDDSDHGSDSEDDADELHVEVVVVDEELVVVRTGSCGLMSLLLLEKIEECEERRKDGDEGSLYKPSSTVETLAMVSRQLQAMVRDMMGGVGAAGR